MTVFQSLIGFDPYKIQAYSAELDKHAPSGGNVCHTREMAQFGENWGL
jgi:hypothetical protein